MKYKKEYKDEIIYCLAEHACKHITRKIIRRLQQLTDCLQSGDDSPLKNIWDEICVQVQGEPSFMWDAYIETIEQFIEQEIQKCDDYILSAIWLQTDEGIDWYYEQEEIREDDENHVITMTYCEDDVIQHILNCVLFEAGYWNNKRIEKYLFGI